MDAQKEDSSITNAGLQRESSLGSGVSDSAKQQEEETTEGRISNGGTVHLTDSTSGDIRCRSSSSRPPFPSLEEPSDATFVQSSFDPVNLLEVGLDELRDRTLSLRCLKRSRSVVMPRRTYPVLEKISSVREVFTIPHYKDLSRRWQELVSMDAEGMAARQSSEKGDGPGHWPADFQMDPGKGASEFVSTEIFSRAASVGMHRQGSRLRSLGQVESGTGTAVELPEGFYSSLAVAPHASLIHLVTLYHQALVSHGLVEEAEKIAGLLEGLQDAEQAQMDVELQGMDLLLKDGLLELYLRIQPHLPPLPTQIVKFKSLTYTTDIFFMDGGYETVLTKALESVQGPLGRKRKPNKMASLKDVTGYLMPGTLTLVLGPPGCGKSSLHQVLSGQVPPRGSSEGMITYNGECIQDVRIHRLAAMVGQRDIHLPPLTVRETLEFARACTLEFRWQHFGPELMEIMGEALKIGQDPKLEIILSMMGLKRVANRPVGSMLIPSITEDERHRLTVAEMLAGAYAVYFFDQLNTFVEDAITYDLISAVRIFTRVRQITVMATLLQPSPEVFDLFDRLILLDQGHIVYQGPRQDALPYFENLGYKKPRHLVVGEFLQEVTRSEGVAWLQPGFKKLELEDFVEAYKRSDMYKDVCRVVNSPDLLQEIWVQGGHPLGLNFVESKHNDEDGLVESSSYLVSGVAEEGGSLLDVSMDHTTNAQPGDKVVAVGGSIGILQYIKSDLPRLQEGNLQSTLEKISEPVRLQLERPFQRVKQAFTRQYYRDYVLEWKPEVVFLIDREFKATWRNKFGLYIRLFQVLVMSIFVGFLLFRVKNDSYQYDMNLFRSAFFVSLLNMTMVNVGQLPALMDERDIYYKQQGAHFFRPLSFLLAKIIGSFPFSLCEATIWTLIVYFLTGISDKDGGWHFFVYYIVMILTVLNGASMVRFFSFFAPDREKAGICIGLVIALFILFAGFLLPRFKVPKYWLWMYYIDPLQWGITALLINEYNSASYSQLCKDVPNLADIPQCVGRPNNTVGHAFLAKGQFYTSNHWIGVAIAVLCVWLLLWSILTFFALSKLRHAKVIRARKPKKEESKINAELCVEDEVENASRNLSHIALPVTLSWHELSYDVMVPSIGQPRTILRNVSGWGEPGDMVALLGSGGAGKTTLLNCLAGRKVMKEQIGGQILVNGYSKVQEAFASYMGYVDRIDAYTPYITIRETIAFSTAMRIGKSSSRRKQQDFVEEVLELMELKHIENTLVISLTSDITFEQEKRLAIATELAANPSVLFLDDPTKGLDSLSASHIVNCLQQIARTGRLVIAALKHPSQRIISMFTKVQILKRGGETVYFGSVGKDGEMIRTYFAAIPGTPLCPPNKSVSSFSIDVIGDGITYHKAIKDYAFEYRVSELALRNHVHLQHLRRSKGQNGPEIERQGYGATYTSMALEVILKLQRQYWRNVNYSWGRMTSYLIMSLLLGSMFFKMDRHTTAGMNSIAGAIFISCMLVGVTNAQNMIPQVVQMRAIYMREKATNHYSLILYNIAWTFAEVPYLMVANLIFCCIFLPMTNIAVDSAAQFFRYWFISFEFYLAITFLGMLLAIVSPMPQIASVLVPIITGIWVATGGLVVPKRKILHQFIWIFWTNPLQYAINSLTSVVFFCDINKLECLNNGLNPSCSGDPTQCPLCDCPRLTDAKNVFVWKQIQFNLSLNYDRIPYDMMALLLFTAVFRFLTFMSMKYMKHNRRT